MYYADNVFALQVNCSATLSQKSDADKPNRAFLDAH